MLEASTNLVVSILHGASSAALLPLLGFRSSQFIKNPQSLMNRFLSFFRNNSERVFGSGGKDIVSSLKDLLAVIDGEGRIIFSNRSFREALGCEDQSPTTMGITEFLEDGERVVESIRGLNAKGKGSLLLGVNYKTRTGRTFPVLLSVSPLTDKEESSGFIFVANDITRRTDISAHHEDSHTKYRSIVESSLDGIIIVQNGSLVYANPTALRVFGYSSLEEVRRLDFSEMIAPASRPFIALSHEGKTVGTNLLRNHEVRGLTKAGKIIDLEMNAIVTEWNNLLAVHASFRDITERKLLEREQALWLWEQETLMRIDRQLVSMVDFQKTLSTITENAKLLTRSDFVGVLMFDYVNDSYFWRAMKGNQNPLPSKPHPIHEIHRDLLKGKEPVILQDLGKNPPYPLESFPVLYNEKVVSAIAFPLVVGDTIEGLLAVAYRKYHIFSDRETRLLSSLAEKSSIAVANAKVYENLLQREKELERLSGARVNSQEDERRRIAREIHDGLGQLLTAIKFNLEILEDTISADSERRRVEDMKNLLDSVMQEAREISYNLMPSVLDDFGLAPALQLLCERFSSRRSINVQFHAHGLTERLEPILEIALYRIAQEALNNVAKHAGASEVTVQIIKHAGGVRLTVDDNGKGITPRTNIWGGSSEAGMGLMSMRERANSFHGALTIDSTPGKGTVVSVEIPLEKGGGGS